MTLSILPNPLKTAATAASSAALLGFLVVTAPAAAAPAPDSFADLAERLSPAVVNISTTRAVQTVAGDPGDALPQLPDGSPLEDLFRRFFDRGPNAQPTPRAPQTALGSGFVISADGYVVTNNHVIDGANEITVTLQDERQLAADLIGRDPKTDLALLKVESPTPLPFVSFGDSDDARVGDWVLAIGNPFGLGGTVTAGIVSARARNINAGPFDDFLQTDAPINRGNSGGPLFDMSGAVIGINTAIFSPSGGNVGIGFAIPANLAEPILDQLMVHGKAIRGWLGVQIQPVTPDIAEGLGLDEPKGALIADVVADSPAAKAGLETGDLIVGFDGQPVDDARDLPRIVAAAAIGAPSRIEVLRDGTEITVEVTIAELDEGEVATVVPAAAPEALGMQLAALTPELRNKFNIDESRAGVLVLDVLPDSPAAVAGLRTGDVVAKVGGRSVETPADVAAAVADAEADERASVLILANRNGENRFLAAPLTIG